MIIWLWSSSTQIWESPGCISHEWSSWLSLFKNISDSIQGSTVEHTISGHWAVASDISDAPYNLLNNLNMLRIKKLNKMIENVLFDEVIHMISGSWCDIGKAPCCFKLEFWNFIMQKLNKDLNKVCINNSLNRWGILNRKKSSQTHTRHQLDCLILIVYHFA